MAHKWLSARRWHTVAGLTAAVWLAVLGVTGFLLDHRDWRWQWQATVAEDWLPQQIIDKAVGSTPRIYQIDTHAPERRVSGGPQGLWWSEDGGKTWAPTNFVGETPFISGVQADELLAWQRLWIATDDGLWLSRDAGASAERVALAALPVTALAGVPGESRLLGVVDKSSVFSLSVEQDGYHLKWLALGSIDKEQLPASIDLSRLTRDLHYGRGLFYSATDLLWNDITAFALLLLPLSGFLFWYLPRRWRSQATHTGKPKRAIMRGLFRVHGPTTGLLCALPVLYLALTGILLDHAKELRAWMKGISISRTLQPPIYSLSSWSGEIRAIAVLPDADRSIVIGTRQGLFQSTDNGQTWLRNKQVKGFVWILRRFGASVYLGGMGGPNRVWRDGQWSIVKGTGHMPRDITACMDSSSLWLSAKGLRDHHGKNYLPASPLPRSTGVSWYFVLDGLHSGLLIHPQWKWVNDLFAVLAIIMVVTGLKRWWRTRWI